MILVDQEKLRQTSCPFHEVVVEIVVTSLVEQNYTTQLARHELSRWILQMYYDEEHSLRQLYLAGVDDILMTTNEQ